MKYLALALAAAGLAVAQIDKLPKCASQCYGGAIQASGCDFTDAYCLCTKGMKHIVEVAIPCLCKSTCKSEELLQAQQASNGICSAALSASGESYHPMTMSPNVCAGMAAGAAPTSAPATYSGAGSTAGAVGGYGGATSAPSATMTAPPYGGPGNMTNMSGTGSATGTGAPASYTGAATKVISWVSEGGMIGLAVWALWAL